MKARYLLLTLAAAAFVLTYDASASGVKKVLYGDAPDTAKGRIELAVQSEMETATDVARAVTEFFSYAPGR